MQAQETLDQLIGTQLPDLSLAGTNNVGVNLTALTGIVVVYVYPMTTQPGQAPPKDWDLIPGARGCTPQSCGFRDHYRELQALGATVYGLSTQASEYQCEAKTRLELPFELLSDSKLQLKKLIGLPTFEAADMELYKRAAIILQDGKICKLFYPVTSPAENAEQVIEWLASDRSQKKV